MASHGESPEDEEPHLDEKELLDPRNSSSKSSKWAIMTLVGGVLIQLFNGVFFLWSNISVYVLSYMYTFGNEVDAGSIYIVDIALVVFNVGGYQIGTLLANHFRWSPKLILALGSSIALGGIFAATFTKNFWAFVMLYGSLSGLGCGINYMIPLVCGWEYYPDYKGRVTGLIIGAYGCSSFVFTQLSTHLVNPDNKPATIRISDNLSYFDADIANHVPGMLRILLCIWLGLVVVAILLTSRPEKETQVEDQEEEN